MEREHELETQAYKLGDLIDLIALERLSLAVPVDNKPCMSLVDFTSQYMLSYITAKNIGPANYRVKTVIKSPCLMAVVSGDHFKVARISSMKGLEEGVYVDRIPFFAFHIKNHNVVNEDYLLRELVSDDMSQQLKRNIKETEQPHKISDLIDENDLLSLRIDLPSLEMQDMVVKNDMLDLLQELMSQKQADFENYQKDIHLKKHAVGQTIFNLNNWWNTLQKARQENNGVLKDDTTTGKIRPVAVGEIYNRIGETLNIISNQINTFTIGDGMEKEKIALAPFIGEYINSHQSPMFTYKFDETGKYATDDFKMKGESVLHKGDPLVYLDFPKQALNQILDNIVSNACSHGFSGIEDKNNIIRIEYNSIGSTCTLTIANNGKPLQKGMSEEKVFMYGGSTAVGTDGHNGLGAFQIRNLMSRFGGTATIDCNDASEYPFAYVLTFQNCISYT
ncbi:MAG: ATP-binding protein [Paludibacteraceae bacterium]|nr:ATP-binding protein [Paludibacteraceae bacterium]